MRVLLTGASGIVGGFVLPALRNAGYAVTDAGRDLNWRLGQPLSLQGHDALIHCAFSHAPGRYRGGEGSDAAGFRRTNQEGTIRLFESAADAGLDRVLFLSSRAVHDGWPAETVLSDDLAARPANLYGEVKAAAEACLAALPLAGTAIRATGLYGPGRANKWQGMFARHLAGQPAPPRVATELHGDDLAAAILLLLASSDPPPCVNASDLVLDHHDLLGLVNRVTGAETPPPPRSDSAALKVLECGRLRQMGWRPGSWQRLHDSLPSLLP